MRPLWPHQADALALLRQSLANGHKRPVVQAPTGAGKTRLAAEIITLALEKANRVTFCVPALALIDQTVEAFWAEGIRDIGVMQADHRMTRGRAAVQVASVQTLARRKFPASDVVIVDECHRAYAVVYRWMAERPELPFIGLSATPWTKGMGKHYDDLLIPTTTRDLIDRGFLCPFEVYAPAHPDLRGVRTVAGDYHEGQLSEAMNKSGLVADIVSNWQEKAAPRPTLVFGVDRAHAKHLQERFLAAGVPAAYQDMNTTEAERAAIRKGFHDGTFLVVCNVGTLTTGVDWDVRCIVLARPTKSEILFVQIVGRGLRNAVGKSSCRVLDHSDTTSRLGFVTDIHHAALDDGKPKVAKRIVPVPKECPRCHFLRPPRTSVCPACGYQAVKPQKLVEGAGRLRKLAARNPSSPLVSIGGALMFKADFYAELRLYARERGYNPAWAFKSYAEATNDGRVPTGIGVAASVVSDPVRRWIKARQIAYYRRKAG